jgi:lipopolysaccharide biosynthesis glycosyltransferase
MRQPVSRPLVLCCDADYTPANVVCLTSIFLNSPGVEFDTYWITSTRSNAVTPEVVSALEHISGAFSRRVSVLPVDDSRFDDFKKPILPYLANIAYTRLLIPDIIDAPSLLYLDSDIIVQETLEPLLSLDTEDSIIAGVSNGTEEHKMRLGLASDDDYINTGVTIINAEMWRREQIGAQLLEWYAKNTDVVLLSSQDMVNAVLAGRKKFLPEKWNTQLHVQSPEDYEAFDADAFRGIFHFTGPQKPWLAGALPKHRALYEKYARVSPLRMPTQLV